MAAHKAVQTGSEWKVSPEGESLFEISKIVCSYSKSSGNPMYTIWHRPVAFRDGSSVEGYGSIFDYFSINPADPGKVGWRFVNFAKALGDDVQVLYDDERPEFGAGAVYEHRPANMTFEEALEASKDEEGCVQFWLLAPYLPGFKLVLEIEHEPDMQKGRNADGTPKMREKIAYYAPASEWIHALELAPESANGHNTLPLASGQPLESFEAP